MHKKFKTITIVLALLVMTVLLTGAVLADEGDTPQTIEELSAAQIAKSSEHASVVDGLATFGTARLIVKVKTGSDFIGVAGLSGADAAAQKALIAEAQADFSAAFPAMAADMVAFRTIPFVSVWARSEADYVSLLASDLVLKVEHDTPELLENTDVAPPAMAEANTWIDTGVFWGAGYDGDGYAVAILDTGVDAGHDFLDDGKVVAEVCYGTVDTDYASSPVCAGDATSAVGPGVAMPYVGDCPLGECDHGTHVAGIAAGNDLGATGFSGVAPAADLIAAQVFSRFDSELVCGVGGAPCVASWDTDQMYAMEDVYELATGTHAYYTGVTLDVVSLNMSLGGGQSYDPCDAEEAARKTLIDNLKLVHVATVISAGNSSYVDSTGYPGCISTAYTVSATWDTSDTIASFSNAAPDITDVWAPGVNITSSIPTLSGGSSGATAVYQGTSMSAPVISGSFAILQSAYPTYSVDQIWGVVETNGVTVTDNRAGGTTVAPRIDFTTALPGAAPAAPVLISPAHAAYTLDVQPMFYWADTVNATKYTIEVSDVATSTSVFKKTYADSARCDGSVCSVPAFSALTPATQYKWHVVAYNDTVKGSWSSWQTFTVGAAGLSMPDLLEPRGGVTYYGHRPTLYWSQVADAERYNVQVYTPSGDILLYNTNGMCVDSECSFRIPPEDHLGADYGTVRWHVQAIDTDAALMSEYPGRVAFEYTRVGMTSTTSPVGTTETVTRPVFTWPEAAGSTAHLVQVLNTDGSKVYEQQYKNDVYCTGGVCSGQVFAHLADGDYTWHVRGKAGLNFGQWTPLASFTVASGGLTWNYPFTDNANGWVDVHGQWDLAESNYYRGDANGAACIWGCASTFHNYRLTNATFETTIASTGTDGYDGFTLMFLADFEGGVLQQAMTVDFYGDPDNLYWDLSAYTADGGWEYWGTIDFSGLGIDITQPHTYYLDFVADRYDAGQARYEEVYWMIDDTYFVTIFDVDFFEGSFGMDVISFGTDHLVDVDEATISVVSGPSMALPEGYFGSPSVNGLFGMSSVDGSKDRSSFVDRSGEALFEFGIWE